MAAALQAPSPQDPSPQTPSLHAPGPEADAQEWRQFAGQLHAQQRLIAAGAAIDRAQALAPTDRLIAFLRAQTRYELGHPAAALFAQVQQLWPDNPDVLRNRALALASEGERDAAELLLAQALDHRPDWLDGQRVLAALRWTLGRRESFAAGYAQAVAALPNHAGLWIGWFGALAQVRDWEGARCVLSQAESRLGQTRQIISANAFLANETGDLASAERWLAQLAGADDAFTAICHMRLRLRQHRPEAVEAVALPLTRGAAAGQAWPYLSTAWRLLGDRRQPWLDGEPPYVTVHDAGVAPAQLAELATFLRGHHTASAPYPDQTVRGGTQTDRSILLRHEPVMQATRAKLMVAIERTIADLPMPDPTHPLLSRSRGRPRLAGSWSVRLGADGHNVAHSHPLGWLSAVFYVGLPSAAQAGPAPVAGQIVIFPSTMWHNTVPIVGGERLNIAFDVIPG